MKAKLAPVIEWGTIKLPDMRKLEAMKIIHDDDRLRYKVKHLANHIVLNSNDDMELTCNMTQIAHGANVPVAAIGVNLKELQEYGIITMTKKTGSSILFKITL